MGQRRTLLLLLALALVVITAHYAAAANFGCSIKTSCLSNETALIGLNSSEAGLAPNDSHAYLMNYSVTQPYVVCCWTDAFRTMNNSCLGNGAAVLRLADTNNTHVQQGNYSTYQYRACLNVTLGNVSCTYADNTCPGGYSNVVSIASSETWAANQTNAHVGSFNEYLHKVCCQIGGQNPPSVAWVIITPINTTTRLDFECQNGTTTDPDADPGVTLSYNWIRNGTSVSFLNLPMDYDSNAGVTHDFSGFGRDMTVNNATFLPTAGDVGGAFSYDGLTSYLTRAHDAALNSTNYTIVAWVKPRGTYDNNAIVGSNQFLFQLNSNTLQFWGDVGLAQATSSVFGYSGGTWMQVAITYNRVATNATFYVNGVLLSSHTLSANDRSFSSLTIGSYAGSRFFNGTLDELIIFNRTLTASEVKTLYATNNRFFNSTDLVRNEGWNCSITPVDSTGLNGSTIYSNMSIVKGSKPLAVNLSYPIFNASLFARFVNFSWTQADERDGDQVNYTVYVVPSGTCAVGTTQNNVLTTNYTYGELCVDSAYNWTINACDVDGCSGNTTNFNFTIPSSPSFVLLVNMSQLGLRNPGESVQTNVTSGLAPFILNNTGNVRLNLSIFANNSPFVRATLPTNNYTFAAGINASNAYNLAQSQMAFTPFTNSSFVNLLRMLNYSTNFGPSNTTANIEVNITVPIGEPAGNKQGNVTLQGVMGAP